MQGQQDNPHSGNVVFAVDNLSMLSNINIPFQTHHFKVNPIEGRGELRRFTAVFLDPIQRTGHGKDRGVDFLRPVFYRLHTHLEIIGGGTLAPHETALKTKENQVKRFSGFSLNGVQFVRDQVKIFGNLDGLNTGNKFIHYVITSLSFVPRCNS